GRDVRACRIRVDQVDRAVEAHAVDDDADAIAVAETADGAARQRFGADVADARSRRDAGKARIGQQRDSLADVEVLERGGDLVNLFHARAERATSGQHDHFAGADAVLAAALDGRNRRAFARENARGPGTAIHAVGIDDARIDGRRLDDRAVGRE